MAWKRKINTKNRVTYVNRDRSRMIEIEKILNKYHFGIYKTNKSGDVIRISSKYFKSKSEALRFAKKYMRKN